MLAGELLPWMLHFHRPWFQKNVLDMGTLYVGGNTPTICFISVTMSFFGRLTGQCSVYTVMETAKANGLNPEEYVT